MKRLRRPRIWYRFLALCQGGFWCPCSRCGKHFGCWEWERDGYPRLGPALCVDSADGQGLCTACAEHARYHGHLLWD
jgi:hypothetical protein